MIVATDRFDDVKVLERRNELRREDLDEKMIRDSRTHSGQVHIGTYCSDPRYTNNHHLLVTNYANYDL